MFKVNQLHLLPHAAVPHCRAYSRETSCGYRCVSHDNFVSELYDLHVWHRDFTSALSIACGMMITSTKLDHIRVFVTSLDVPGWRTDGRTDGRTAEVVQSLMRHFRLGAAGVMRSFVELKRRWCRLVCLKLCPFYAVHARRTAAIRCVVIACCETHTETDRQTDTDKNVSWPARFDAVCLRCFHVSSSDKSLAEILAFVCFLELLLFKISNWFKTSQILSSNEETVANYGKCITTQSR